MNRRNSDKYFKDAQEVMVGGVNSPVRSFKGVGGQPLIMRNGKGSRLYDVDGNAYTDYCLSWGSLISGHAHRNIVLAAKKTVERGTSFGTTTRREVDLARLIVSMVASIDQIRFVNSGTEAAMSAIRLARGFTGRSKVIKFDGCYHGHVDALLTKAGSGVAQLDESSSAGIPPGHIQDTLSLRYNDVEQFRETIDQQGQDVACVIVEPVAGNMGVIPGTDEFIQILREQTKKKGIVLIFDEIMTGFRTSLGCVQKDMGITPDLTCFGKIIGGGFPIGAYGGRKDIMEHLAPSGGVYQAGTFSGNPVVMAAGYAAMRLLNKSFYKTLNDRSETFAVETNEALSKAGAGVHISGYKSMMSLRFRKEPVLNYDDAQDASGGDRYGKLFRYLLESGVYWPPADLEAFFVSGMHTKSDLAVLRDAIIYFFVESDGGTSARTMEAVHD